MKMINKAQNNHGYLLSKHKNVFLIKIKLQRYMYVLSKTNHIHTYSKHKRVHNVICMKASDSRSIHVYLLDLNKNTYT